MRMGLSMPHSHLPSAHFCTPLCYGLCTTLHTPGPPAVGPPPPPDRAACLRTATHKNLAPLLCSRRGASFRQGAFTEFSNKRPRPPGCGAQRQTSRLQKAPRRKARHYDFVCETRAAGFQRRLRGVGRAAQLPLSRWPAADPLRSAVWLSLL